MNNRTVSVLTLVPGSSRKYIPCFLSGKYDDIRCSVLFVFETKHMYG